MEFFQHGVILITPELDNEKQYDRQKVNAELFHEWGGVA